jgi:hypothetical protein
MNMQKIFPLLAMALLVTACSNSQYFEIEDPTTGKLYYANEVKRQKDGSVKFKDQVTGAAVRIQNSEIRPLDKKTYQAKKEQAKAPVDQASSPAGKQ